MYLQIVRACFKAEAKQREAAEKDKVEKENPRCNDGSQNQLHILTTGEIYKIGSFFQRQICTSGVGMFKV